MRPMPTKRQAFLAVTLFAAVPALALGVVARAANTDPNNPTGTRGLVLVDKVGRHIRFVDPTTFKELSSFEAGVAPHDPLPAVGERVLRWAREAAERHEGVVFGVSHEAPLAAAYVVGRGADFSSFRAVNVPLLGSVRLEPGPPELVDPVSTLHC